MANDVRHKITFTGSDRAIDAMVASYFGPTRDPDETLPTIDFEKAIPAECQVVFTKRHLWGCHSRSYGPVTFNRTSGKLVIGFATASSVPWNIIDELTRLCPEVSFEGSACDEDMNLGLTFRFIPGQTRGIAFERFAPTDDFYEAHYGCRLDDDGH